MILTKNQITELVIETLKEVQTERGKDLPENITANTNPFRSLEEFDSQLGILVSVKLRKKLEMTGLPPENFCLSEDETQGLQVKEIAKRVQKAMNAQND